MLMDLLCEAAPDDQKPMLLLGKKSKVVARMAADMMSRSIDIDASAGEDAARAFCVDANALLDEITDRMSNFFNAHPVPAPVPHADNPFIDPTP